MNEYPTDSHIHSENSAFRVPHSKHTNATRGSSFNTRRFNVWKIVLASTPIIDIYFPPCLSIALHPGLVLGGTTPQRSGTTTPSLVVQGSARLGFTHASAPAPLANGAVNEAKAAANA
jgi:hypothetical protein